MPRGIKGSGKPKVSKSQYFVVPMAEVDSFKAGDLSVAVMPPTAGHKSAVNAARAHFLRSGVTKGEFAVVRSTSSRVGAFAVVPASGVEFVAIKG